MCEAEAQTSKKTFILNKLYKFRDVVMDPFSVDTSPARGLKKQAYSAAKYF
jgi:hypothetical protein